MWETTVIVASRETKTDLPECCGKGEVDTLCQTMANALEHLNILRSF